MIRLMVVAAVVVMMTAACGQEEVEYGMPLEEDGGVSDDVVLQQSAPKRLRVVEKGDFDSYTNYTVVEVDGEVYLVVRAFDCGIDVSKVGW